MMAYNFPNLPTVGQIFQHYVWDGEKWNTNTTPVVVGDPGPVISLLASSDSGISSSDFITNVTNPVFNVDLTGAVVGNILKMYDVSVLMASRTLTSGDIAGGDIDLGITPLLNGSHSIKAQIDRSVGGLTEFGNTISLLVDTIPPTVTSPTTFNQAEGVGFSHSLAANETVTWAKTGGVDSGKFTFNPPNTLTLPAKSYSVPDDSDGNRSYLVQMTATDTAGNATVHNITVNITSAADVVAPILSSPFGNPTGPTTATLTVSTNEANGTLYGVLTLTSAAPTKAQIKAGQNASGTAALFAFNQVVSVSGVQTKNASGLASSTTYFVFFMHEDAATNQSNVPAGVSFITSSGVDVTAPVLTVPQAIKTGSTTASLSVNTDEANGTLYGVLTLNSTPPNKAQIKAGLNAAGTVAAYSFNQAVSVTGIQPKSVAGLTGSTTYFAFYMHEDASTNQSNVPSVVSFVTDAAGDTTAPVLSSPSGVKTGQTTATLGVTTDEGNGTLYGVLTLNSSPPSKAQIKLGQNALGAAAAYSFNQSISTIGIKNNSATGLIAGTTYFAFYMHEDAAANQSNVPTVVSFTTDAIVGSTTLDPAKKHAAITLSGGNLTALHDPANVVYNSVMSVAGHSTGKYHWEMHLDHIGTPSANNFGISTASGNLASYVGSDAEGVGIGGDGSGYYAGTFPGSWGPATATGDTLVFELDLDASPQIIRFANGTGAWSADHDISAVTGTGPYYAMAALFAPVDQVTFNFGATTFVKTPTSGFGSF